MALRTAQLKCNSEMCVWRSRAPETRPGSLAGQMAFSERHGGGRPGRLLPGPDGATGSGSPESSRVQIEDRSAASVQKHRSGHRLAAVPDRIPPASRSAPIDGHGK